MSGSAWIPALVSVAAAALSYAGARAGAKANREMGREATDQREAQARREEWGRRFTTALELLSDDDEQQRKVGHAMLAALLSSDLATKDDRALGTQALGAVVADFEQENSADLDDIDIVVDDGGTRGRGEDGEEDRSGQQ